MPVADPAPTVASNTDNGGYPAPPRPRGLGGAEGVELPESYGAGLLGTLVRLNLAVSDVLAQITGDHGTNLADYLVLGLIRASEDSLSSPGAIAATLGRTSGGMTLTIDRLIGAGWVHKSKDPSDGRRAVVGLTDEGMRVAVAVNRSLHEWEQELSLEGSEQVIALLESLTQEIVAKR